MRRIEKYSSIALQNQRNRDKEYQRQKRAKLKGYKAEESRIYREKYPEKVKAQQSLNRAVKNGKIKKSPCVDCDTTYRVQAHHPNYKKVLEIIWLCAIHHKNYHKSLVVNF